MRSTSHMVALSDRGPQGLFLPLGAGDDAAAHINSTNANTHRVLAGHQAPPAAFNLHNKPRQDDYPLGPKRPLRHGAVQWLSWNNVARKWQSQGQTQPGILTMDLHCLLARERLRTRDLVTRPGIESNCAHSGASVTLPLGDNKRKTIDNLSFLGV